MAEVQQIIEAWRLDYNQRRPHSSFGHLIPNEFVAQNRPYKPSKMSSALVKDCLVTRPMSLPDSSPYGALRWGEGGELTERSSKPFCRSLLG